MQEIKRDIEQQYDKIPYIWVLLNFQKRFSMLANLVKDWIISLDIIVDYLTKM